MPTDCSGTRTPRAPEIRRKFNPSPKSPWEVAPSPKKSMTPHLLSRLWGHGRPTAWGICSHRHGDGRSFWSSSSPDSFGESVEKTTTLSMDLPRHSSAAVSRKAGTSQWKVLKRPQQAHGSPAGCGRKSADASLPLKTEHALVKPPSKKHGTKKLQMELLRGAQFSGSRF